MFLNLKNFVDKIGTILKISMIKGHTIKDVDNRNGLIQQGDNNRAYINTKNMELKEKLEQILNAADLEYFPLLSENNQMSVLLTEEELNNLREIEYSLLNKNVVRIESNGNMVQNRPDGKMRTGWVIYKLSDF